MKTFILVWCLLSMPVIGWVAAKFWVLCGYLWCLEIYPDWLDKFIYAKATPFLASDMILAAEQMEFLEVWIASTIILEIFALSMFLLLKDKFNP
jgi:hypothetical protein